MIAVPGLKITGPLGKGGTAEVALAHSTEFNKDVALKYPLDDSSTTLEQFQKLAQREFTLIGKLKFPGVVKILKISHEPAYLLLELCKGQSLDKLGRIDNQQMLLNIICSLAANLEFLRLNKIVHCDLKPQNVFLPSDFPLYENGKLFFTKISDFSLGRFSEEPESIRAGHGTVGFAAPETLKPGKSSHRADLFALGVIAYQLSTGKHPFAENETDPVKIESRIQESEPEPVTKFRQDLSPAIIELIKSLLSKDENKRPKTGWTVCELLNKSGCLFPYEKVISPSFLVKSQNQFDTFVNEYLELSEKQKDQLIELTDSRPDYLRLILSANLAKGILFYTGDKFAFRTNIYWPAYLRRLPLKYFSNVSSSEKKELIKLSVTHSKVAKASTPPAIGAILRQLVSRRTLIGISIKAAQEFKSKSDFHQAAILFLQAGQLEDAIGCAEKASRDLKVAKSRTAAIHLINRVEEFAHFVNRQFEMRQLLMIKGDIERSGGDIDSSMLTYNKIIALYDGHPPDKLLAETYRDMGDLYKSKQKFELGIEVLNKALEIYRGLKDELEMSRALNNIGELYRIATDLPKSLKYMRQALAIQKRLNDPTAVANSLNNIAITFGMKGRLKRAISILELSLKMKRTIGDQGEIARALNNLGYAHQLTGNSAKALVLLKESLAINRSIGSKKEILSNLWNLSEIMIKGGQLKEALANVKEGQELSITLNMKPQQAHFNKSMGNICQRMGRFSEAENCYEQSAILAREIDDKVLQIRLLISRSELRSTLGDSKSAASLAEQALASSISSNAKIEEFQALLILVKSHGKAEHLKQARALVEELKLKRERILLDFAYLQFLLDIDAKSDLKRIYEIQKPNLEKFRTDIEYPELINTAAEIELICGDKSAAASFVDESLRLSHSRNLLMEEVTALILAARIAIENVDFEKAFSYCKAALQICKQTVETILANDDKLMFMKKPKVVYLAGLIKKLNEKIGPKQKAGVTTPAPEVN